jgi:hypothetical protein
MADPNDDIKFDKGKEKQTIGGQQSHRSEYGRQGDQTAGSEDRAGEAGQPQPGSSSAPPRSMGTHGTEFGQMSDYDRSGQQGQSGTGQADLGGQAGSTLSGHTDQQDLGDVGGEMDQPASYGGGGRQSHTEGEGFILQQGSGAAEEEEEEDDSEGHPS